ncbi:hypothetical protein [Variovorax sp. dw_954]|uniref:hypothetical protein n=1 Tax=Variovorax sp. dw_954 TaxID=2720078 RepID=UPI001BD28ACE|nr:hypothetical protein [Variovorax sp. dw_954]
MSALDSAPRRAVAALCGLLVLAGLAVACVMWLLHPMRGTATADAPVRDDASQPALQSAPQLDLTGYRAQKQRELDNTGPVPGEPGYARIPLAQAMDLIAARGLHAASSADARARP